MSKVKRGDQLAQVLQDFQGVPSVAVDGKYLVGGKRLQRSQLAITDKLIAKARAEKPGKK